MFEARRIETSIQPQKIEFLGNGTYYYNYDIQSKEVEVTDMVTNEPTIETRYDFVQVHLTGAPEYKRCVEVVIRQHLDVNEEFDLINSMNKLTMGLSENENDRAKYQAYLELVDTIKTNIKVDFA